MAGGPSHLELFDRKPKLAELDGQPMPESLTRGQQLAQLQGQKLVCLGPLFPFRKYGQSGIEICTLLPHLGAAIDICLVRSMTTEAINHDPAHMFMNTGSQIVGRPSIVAEARPARKWDDGPALFDSQSNKGPVGRDHHNKSMSLWLAGAGVRGGLVYGATDDLGYAAVEEVCTAHDLHATMLHQLGIQHDAFSVKFQGLDAKLTGVEGARVLKDIVT